MGFWKEAVARLNARQHRKWFNEELTLVLKDILSDVSTVCWGWVGGFNGLFTGCSYLRQEQILLHIGSCTIHLMSLKNHFYLLKSFVFFLYLCIWKMKWQVKKTHARTHTYSHTPSLHFTCHSRPVTRLLSSNNVMPFFC